MAIRMADKAADLEALISGMSRKEKIAHAEMVQQRAREEEADDLRALVSRVRTLIEDEGFSVDQVADQLKPKPVSVEAGKKTPSGSRGPMPPKYRDPETGQTWAGQGKPRKWMPKNKEQWVDFLIDKPPQSDDGELAPEREHEEPAPEIEHEAKPKRSRGKSEAAE